MSGQSFCLWEITDGRFKAVLTLAEREATCKLHSATRCTGKSSAPWELGPVPQVLWICGHISLICWCLGAPCFADEFSRCWVGAQGLVTAVRQHSTAAGHAARLGCAFGWQHKRARGGFCRRTARLKFWSTELWLLEMWVGAGQELNLFAAWVIWPSSPLGKAGWDQQASYGDQPFGGEFLSQAHGSSHR